jgi:hypothetical protein
MFTLVDWLTLSLIDWLTHLSIELLGSFGCWVGVFLLVDWLTL